jgi:hypothetical protein
MTLHKRDRKVIEAPEGTGQVLREGKEVAKVSYALLVEMLETGAKSFGIPKETRLKHKAVSGKISVLSGNIMLTADAAGLSGPFTLVMEDGRKVDFFIDGRAKGTNAAQHEYEIRGSGSRL